MALFARGRRLFAAASIATIVVAGLHTIGNTVGPTPTEHEYVAMENAMRGYRVPLGMGMTPSVWDIYQSLVFTMSICLVAMGATGLAAAGSDEATPGLIARLALVLTISSAALTVLYWAYRITPGFVSMVVVTLLFAGAIRTSQSS